MAKTVDELRNEIRLAVGRFEREVSTAFTKEDLAAICEAAGHDVGDGRLPSTARMRASIRRNVDGLAAADTDTDDRPFRKAELEAIAAAVRDE